MSDFVVLVPADQETEEVGGTTPELQAIYDIDAEFGRDLQARGGRITGGAELSHSSRTCVLRPGPGTDTLVTEGPFAESTEQMSGFYIVSAPSLEVVVEAAGVLVRAHPAVEVRPIEGD